MFKRLGMKNGKAEFKFQSDSLHFHLRADYLGKDMKLSPPPNYRPNRRTCIFFKVISPKQANKVAKTQ